MINTSTEDNVRWSRRPGSFDGISALQQTETDKRGFFPAVLSSLRGLLRDPDEEENRAVAAAGVPVLAIWGAEDDVIPLSARDVLTGWNPAAQPSSPGAGWM